MRLIKEIAPDRAPDLHAVYPFVRYQHPPASSLVTMAYRRSCIITLCTGRLHDIYRGPDDRTASSVDDPSLHANSQAHVCEQAVNLRPSRPLLRLLCVVVFASWASFGRSQTTDTVRQEPVSPTAATTERPAYPLVVRIDQTALDPLAVQEINQRGRVDMEILGTHAVGESRAQGAISVHLIPDRDEASFDLRFRGRTHSKAVGINGPALIYCHADTGFACTRPVLFDPTRGFVAEAGTIVAKTKLVYDGFGSSRDGLGRRLISRVAERCAGELREQARQIAARDTEHKLLSAFDKQVNTQLAAMNKQLNVVFYTNLFLGKGFAKQLAARSSKDCIHIGVGKQGGPAQLTVIPPRHELVAPIEIWVHSTSLAEPVTKSLALVKNKTILPQTSRLELLQALSLPPEESGRLKDLAVYDGWIVFGLQNAAAEGTTTTIKHTSTSDLTQSPGGK